jgi:protein-L-isoaspartate(D-aspartate) O-methyltransferase
MRKHRLQLFVLMGLSALLILFLTGSLRAKGEEDIYSLRREAMVAEQIEARGVKNEKVLQAMRSVPRHKFVPEDLISHAYQDSPLPIGFGQTISQPYIVALMTELLDPESSDVALEVGTGSAYQAAVLSEIVDQVYTIEIFEELGTSARERLKGLGCDNVEVKIADGYHGWPEHGPFDVIIVTCAAAHVPPPLIEQLKEGGKMCIPVGSVFWAQNLMLVEKKDGKIISKNILPVRFVPMLGEH